MHTVFWSYLFVALGGALGAMARFAMNVFMLDEKRVIVEENEGPMMDFLSDWGFEPIPCPFRSNYRFGGSFHCATVDVRRRGTLQSYF